MKEEILLFLDELFPNAHCELTYKTKFQLLIAIILSAQTTDNKVNSITPILFEKYKTIKDLAEANISDVIKILNPLGLANNKAKNIIETAKCLIEKYSEEIPSKKEELITLPGVGVKTANVYMAEGLKIQAFAVDTHVSRVSNRLGISKSPNPIKIEEDLKKFFKDNDWIKLHHQFIFFGRYFCKAKNPECMKCKLKRYCNY
jgi:endonuclease-3